eukprot:6457165-Amphidinium_carterae.1
MTRTCLKACKRQWIERQCQSVSDDLAAHDSWKAYRSIKATCGRAKKPGGFRLALEDGTVTMDEKVVDKQWTDYWLTHFNAVGSSQNSFMHAELNQRHEYDGTLRVTVDEVLAVLTTLRAKKATPNVLSGEGWLRIYDELAAYLASAINHCLTAGDLPNGWKGSVVVPIRKGTLSGLKCSSFRPIQLVTSERKTLGKLLLDRIKPLMDNDPAQFCIGSAAGTALPVFALNQLLAQARTENKSSAVLFLDIKAAYDCVIQELVLPESENDDSVVCALVKLGLEDAQARSSLAYIREHPDALVNSELPPPLRAILINWMKDSWSILAREWQRERQSYMPDEVYTDQRRGADRVLELFQPSDSFAPNTVQTDRGIKQGDSLSTWLFCGLFKIVLNHSMEAFSRTGLQDSSMPTWPVPSLKGDSTSVPKCFTRVERLGYADDVGIPLMDKDGSRLLRAVEALMKASHESFKAFGFQLNYKKGKSALMLRLTGRDAKGIWQHMKHCSHSSLPLCTDFGPCDDSDVELDPTADIVAATDAEIAKDLCIYVDHDIPLQICTQYIYLGSWVTSQMNIMKEVRVRKAAAIKSFNTHASILTSVAFTIHQRLSLCKTLCVCHLLQQLHAFPSLPRKAMAVLESTYISLLKRTCRLDLTTPDEWKSVGSETVLRAIGEPPLCDILTARRLTFLQSVMSCGNPLIEACAMLKPKDSVTTAWYQALNQLRERVPSLGQLPAADSGTFSTWIGFIIPAQSTWKSMLKKTFTQPVLTAVRKQHTLSVMHFDINIGVDMIARQAPDDRVEQNLENDGMRIGDGEHEMDEHDVADVIELTCRHCGKVFGTKRGLASHLRTKHQIYPPLALRTYSTDCSACGAQLLSRNNLLQHLANRLVCGLYVLENGPPMSYETYRSKVHELDTERSVLTRTRVPRTGPIPIVAGKPCSQGVEAVNPYHTMGDDITV